MKGKINAITNILFYIGLGLFFLFHIVPVLMNIFFSVIDYGKKFVFSDYNIISFFLKINFL